MGAGLSGFVTSATAAGRNIVVDGCPVACGATSFGVDKAKTHAAIREAMGRGC
jgi:uncharacterized metal-binding protein